MLVGFCGRGMGGYGLMSGAAAQGKIIPSEEGKTSGKAPVGAGVGEVEEAGEAAVDMACSVAKPENRYLAPDVLSSMPYARIVS